MQRKLIFEGSKLSDVVDEFNRYNRTQIVIEDPKLRDFEISGVYASPDPASLLRFLRDQGVKVTEGDDEIHRSALVDLSRACGRRMLAAMSDKLCEG